MNLEFNMSLFAAVLECGQRIHWGKLPKFDTNQAIKELKPCVDVVVEGRVRIKGYTPGQNVLYAWRLFKAQEILKERMGQNIKLLEENPETTIRKFFIGIPTLIFGMTKLTYQIVFLELKPTMSYS